LEKLAKACRQLQKLQSKSLFVRLAFFERLGNSFVKRGLLVSPEIETHHSFGTCSKSPFGYHAVAGNDLDTCIFCKELVLKNFEPVNIDTQLQRKIEIVNTLQKSCCELVSYIWGISDVLFEVAENKLKEEEINTEHTLLGCNPCTKSPCHLHVLRFFKRGEKNLPPNLVKYIPKDNSIEVRCIFCGGKDESQETN
jgi:hypothetical protein